MLVVRRGSTPQSPLVGLVHPWALCHIPDVYFLPVEDVEALPLFHAYPHLQLPRCRRRSVGRVVDQTDDMFVCRALADVDDAQTYAAQFHRCWVIHLGLATRVRAHEHAAQAHPSRPHLADPKSSYCRAYPIISKDCQQNYLLDTDPQVLQKFYPLFLYLPRPVVAICAHISCAHNVHVLSCLLVSNDLHSIFQ